LIAARRLGISVNDFKERIDAFEKAGFPSPDPVTGHYDIEAIDRYIEARNPKLFGKPDDGGAITDPSVIKQRIAQMSAGRG
jgi:ABC-type glycerol-3-phosphate transport system substrate-binding protein